MATVDTARKQATIVYMQGEDAVKAFTIADSDGDQCLGHTWVERLKNYLAQWDNTGGEYQWEDERETFDGLEVSFVYGTDEDGLPLSTAEVRYVLKWNESASWCALEVHASEKFIAANQS